MRYKIVVNIRPKNLFYDNITNFINQYEFYLTSLMGLSIYYRFEDLKNNFNIDYILNDFINYNINDIKFHIMNIGVVYKHTIKFTSCYNKNPNGDLIVSFAKKSSAIYSTKHFKEYVEKRFRPKNNLFDYTFIVTDGCYPIYINELNV